MTLQMWDPDTATVAWLQSQLNALGFGPIDVDGAYGPQTSAAVAAYQSSRGLNPDGIYGADTEAALTGQTGPTQAGLSAQDLIRQRYGYLAWAYTIPELTTIFDQAIAGNWDEARIRGALEATVWWQNTSAAQRTWAQIVAEDPATAEARRAATQASISDQAAQLGLTLDQATLYQIVETALSTGATSAQVTDMLVSHIGSQPGYGTILATQNDLRGMASAYGVPVSDQTLSTWSGQIAGGSATPDGFLTYISDQAKLMFPALAAHIDAGQTVRQVVEPYFQIAQRELGTTSGQIDLADPKWSRPINQLDDAGLPRLLNQNEWIATLRTDPTYGYDTTVNGQSAAVDLTTQIQKMFGALG